MEFTSLFLLVTCLGVWLDSQLTFTPHVQLLARCCIYYMWQIQMLRRSLNTDSSNALVHALIASRLDYCNSVLYRINTSTTKTLQSILYSATRLIMLKRKFDSIIPTLGDDLYWLPVSQRIVYKLCIIIYRCLHQTVPKYLQELCVPVTTNASFSHLRSAARGDLQVLATRTVTFGPCSFAASAPKLWNSLLPALRDSTLTLTQFGSRLKTHLFCLAYVCAS